MTSPWEAPATVSGGVYSPSGLHRSGFELFPDLKVVAKGFPQGWDGFSSRGKNGEETGPEGRNGRETGKQGKQVRTRCVWRLPEKSTQKTGRTANGGLRRAVSLLCVERD